MQSRLDETLSIRWLLLPRNNHWFKRILLLFAFILFDYLSTLAFCHAPYEEANLYARAFMDSFGIQAGLTLFVLAANLPIYAVLSFDSHVVRLPPRIAVVLETTVDALFAWFVAGLHFSGGSSWFWAAVDLPRQAFGAGLYMIIALWLVKPYRPRYSN